MMGRLVRLGQQVSLLKIGAREIHRYPYVMGLSLLLSPHQRSVCEVQSVFGLLNHLQLHRPVLTLQLQILRSLQVMQEQPCLLPQVSQVVRRVVKMIINAS